MRRLLVRRFISFIEKVRNSSKIALSQLLNLVEGDVRMTTGHNLRTIMLQAGLNRLTDVKIGNCDFDYHQVSEVDIKELVEIRHGDLDVPGVHSVDIPHITDNTHFCPYVIA